MAAKRFTMNEDGYIWDNKKPISQETVLDKLNELHEENKQLQHDATILIQSNQDYRKENKQLKSTLNEIREIGDYQYSRINELFDENEQLKSFKNDVHDLIDELIKKAEKDVEDLRKDAYEKGYAYNPYYYWGVAHGLKKLKKELEND